MSASIFHRSMAYLDKFVPPKYLPLWNHPAGPKTIFFWCPFFKWSLVLAGLSDIQRPPESVSLGQSIALGATGGIWARYCLVITPVNYNLCAVNVFVGLVGIYQTVRVLRHQRQLSEQQQSEDEKPQELLHK